MSIFLLPVVVSVEKIEKKLESVEKNKIFNTIFSGYQQHFHKLSTYVNNFVDNYCIEYG